MWKSVFREQKQERKCECFIANKVQRIVLLRDLQCAREVIVNFLVADEELNYPEPDNYLEELQAPAEK